MDRPLCFVTCTAKLPVIISKMHGGQISNFGRVTCFSSIHEPEISKDQYVQRLQRLFSFSAEDFLTACVYILRLINLHGIYVFNDLSFHRLFLTALLVAVKFHEDRCWTNKIFAKGGGVTLCELNKMEVTLCLGLRWHLSVTEEDLRQMQTLFLQAMDE